MVSLAAMSIRSQKQSSQKSVDATIKAPSAWMMLLEGRAPWELAATFALNGRVMESPGTTGKLHKVMDDLCETAFWDKCARPIEQQIMLLD